MTPLLRCRDARIEQAGVSLVESLTGESASDHVVLTGDWTALFLALSGRASVTRGELLVQGVAVAEAVASGNVGLMSRECSLPPDWTVLDYLARSAELIGLRPRAARRMASSALDLTGLNELSKRKLRTLDDAGRRAVLVAHATLGSPPAIVLEQPLAGLADAAAAFLHEVIRRAESGRRSLVSIAHTGAGPERALSASAEEILLAGHHGQVISFDPRRREGPGASFYVIAAARGAAAFAEELGRRGLVVRARTGQGDAARLLVELAAEKTTDDILDAAVQLGVPLLEMMPLLEAPYGPGPHLP